MNDNNKLSRCNDLDITTITDNLSIMDSDWSIHLYNSEITESGVDVGFDEIVTLRDALNEIIDSRKLQ